MRKNLFFIVLTLLSSFCFGQEKDSTNTHLVDAIDIVHFVLGRKREPDSVKNSDLTKGSLTFIPGFAYSQLKGLALVVEGNYSFKTADNTNVSVIRFVPEVTLKKYVIPRITSSIWFKDNKFNLSTDWRFYRFLAVDYGLGSSTNSENFNNYELKYVRFHQILSKSVHENLLVGVGYNLDMRYDIKRLETEINTNSSAYNLQNRTVSSGLLANVLFDSRKNENFPVGGETYAQISLNQNLKSLGASSNYRSFYSDLRKYYSVNQSKTNILALRYLNWFTFKGNTPYFDLPTALGDMNNNISRPYIEGRFRGKNLIYLESEYRFNLLKNEFLGAAVFLNTETFSEPISNKFKTFNIGTGASLRFKVNKKAKVFLVVSYGLATQNGKGLFFNLGDVF
ncbi:hypothetical protein EGI22_23915 [Lacihabitans sp. LS3-19]|uniref:hypothetical protein n=1 Tax=Lacihabitans sp. LS3-19 TaxID=2487335 RepID=UPI0020CCB3CF|nr:hypothetical protein [Lacihabitans sp. LS3-19]MCP9770963.1 hypothetical protein [Lacihabitans sp. LS3-19]